MQRCLPFCLSFSLSLSVLKKSYAMQVVCEPGTMMFMHPDMKSSVECGNCSRVCAGESCCKAIFTNGGSNQAYVALTPNFPAKVVPINLSSVGNKFIAKKGSFLSSVGDVSIKANFDCCSMAACCGGLGAVRQEADGTGTVFLAAGGTVLQKTLASGEVLIIDTESVVGFQESVKFGVRLAGGCCTCCFG